MHKLGLGLGLLLLCQQPVWSAVEYRLSAEERAHYQSVNQAGRMELTEAGELINKTGKSHFGCFFSVVTLAYSSRLQTCQSKAQSRLCQ